MAEHLGNTPSVSRSSYVDPRVVERFEDGETIDRNLLRHRALVELPVVLSDLNVTATRSNGSPRGYEIEAD